MKTLGLRKQGVAFQSAVCIFIVTFNVLINELIEAGNFNATNSTQLAKNKGTVKTIETDDGDVIDCVNIYQQPAFDHPLLKNHTIEEIPAGAILSGYKEGRFNPKIIQNWYRNGECPEETIPIMRTPQSTPSRSLQYFPHKMQLNQSVKYSDAGHEYAQVTLSGGKYHGAQANLNVWQPVVAYDGEFSIAQIWVTAGPYETLNTVEAGWIANLFRKQRTYLFIYWTNNGYKSGCYNLICPGFVQTNRKFALGASITPLSSYSGHQFYIYINIFQNISSTNWWLQVNNEVIGYWPGKLYDKLVTTANNIIWGGEIVNLETGGSHTSTQMGSGHFASEGFGKAAFFQNVGYHGKSDAAIDLENLRPYVSNSYCYDLLLKEKNHKAGTHFYFGGPGRSDTCP